MKYAVIFHKQSEIELLESREWYAKRNLNIANKFSAEVITNIEFIKQNPYSCTIIYGTKRKVDLKKFPYSIVFSIHQKEIFILSIFHHSRDPSIWKKRT